jgi:hypothetical protein
MFRNKRNYDIILHETLLQNAIIDETSDTLKGRKINLSQKGNITTQAWAAKPEVYNNDKYR